MCGKFLGSNAPNWQGLDIFDLRASTTAQCSIGPGADLDGLWSTEDLKFTLNHTPFTIDDSKS